MGLRWAPYRVVEWRARDTWGPHKAGQEEAEGLEWALRVTDRERREYGLEVKGALFSLEET